MKKGDGVRLAGVPVGHVQSVSLFNDASATRVQALLKVNSKVAGRIRGDSKASIKQIGLTGRKFVEIALGSDASPPLRPGGIIKEETGSDLDSFMASADRIFQRLDRITSDLESVLVEFHSGEGSAAKFIKDPELYTQFKNMLANSSALLEAASSSDSVFGKLTRDKKLAQDLTSLTASLASFSRKLESSEGALGKLASDPELFGQIKATVKNLDEFLAQAKLNLDKLAQLTGAMEELVSQLETGDGALAKLIRDPQLHIDLSKTAATASRLLEKAESDKSAVGILLSDPQLASDLRSSMKSFAAFGEKLNSENSTLGKLATDGQLYAQLSAASSQLNSILTRIEKGNGILGSLASSDTEFSKELEAFLVNLKNLTAELQNNPQKFVKFSLF